MAQQTAVEWLQEQLNPDMKTMHGHIIQDLLEQAKKMENDQIIDAFESGYNNGYDNKCKSGFDYVNETFAK